MPSSAEAPLDEKTRRSLKFFTIEGAMFNGMVAITEHYLNPFAIALGAGNFAIGLTRSLPPLLVSFAQPVGLRLARLFSSRKQFIMAVVFLQALSLLLLISIPFLFRENSEIALLIFFSIYSVLSPLGVPVWTSWMADLVPAKIRGTYFGNRNMVGGAATFLTILFAGFLLSFFGQNVFLGFSVLFITASIFRLLSFASFAKIYEPPQKVPAGRLDMFGFIREVNRNEFGIFLLYYSLLIFSTAMAGFYFSVYMIRELGFPFTTFAVIEGLFAISTLLSNRYWGKVIDRFGNKLVLSVCGMLVPFVPLLWLTSKSPVMLSAFEIFSGFAWAGLNLAVFNYVIGFGSLKSRTEQYAANFNFFQGIAVFAGALLGAFLVVNGSFLNFSGIRFVMLVSGVLRLLVGVAFLPLIREFTSVEAYRGNALLDFAFYMPARRMAFFVHEAYAATGERTRTLAKKIRHRI